MHCGFSVHIPDRNNQDGWVENFPDDGEDWLRVLSFEHGEFVDPFDGPYILLRPCFAFYTGFIESRHGMRHKVCIQSLNRMLIAALHDLAYVDLRKSLSLGIAALHDLTFVDLHADILGKNAT